MTGVLDAEIDQLLCEAEGRLQGAAMPVAQASPQPRLKTLSQPAGQEYAKPSKITDRSLAVQPGKDLSVRLLQPGSASKAAKKVSSPYPVLPPSFCCRRRPGRHCDEKPPLTAP